MGYIAETRVLNAIEYAGNTRAKTSLLWTIAYLVGYNPLEVSERHTAWPGKQRTKVQPIHSPR